ncbi:TPR-like protein [Fistulina hepatica ATCC 64428]|uniref:mRNA 3'-end-processing protein RNA14 n=1 Tax=Fistulina hepatica ATCC 64428 TaxID=1128425 RepID=A0A0D7A218_9AGAR|nr:TPR-like protein [Fistulina hepatica ATCC 64428]
MAVDEPKPSTDAAVDNATDNNTSQPDEIDLLIQRAQQEHDPELWKRITEMADASGDHDKVRKAYDALLKRYPNSSFAQIAYINHFLNDQTHFGDAEDLFKKFLRMSPSVDLWKFFLTYVRRVTSGPSMRDTIRKSYEFALSHIGQDRDSADVWADYIEFIKTGPATTTWEEQQKMDALRKVYQRAIQIPLSNVERLYQEYEDFENGLNKITAKKFLADLNPSYVQAKSVLRQLTTHLSGLGLPRSDEFFLPTPPVFNEADRTLIGRWKNYLKWEEKNPLEIEDKDKAQLITRLQGVYRRAVIRMRFFPEIWFMAYTWSSKAGKNDEAETMLVAGMEANPGSYLMNFAYAELKESQKDHNAAREIFESFLALLRKEMEESEKSETPQPASANGNGNGDSGSKDSSFISLQEEAKPTSAFAQRQKEYGLAYIMYMRFAQRSEGVKASRAVFGKARRDNWVPWEVYEAAALMEYHCSSESVVASRIFESGLKKFSDDTDYIVRYLGFLISINDVNNARALFERVITNFEPERARVLWERWGRYVYQYDDLESAQKFEKRMAEVYPGGDCSNSFSSDRHADLTSVR